MLAIGLANLVVLAVRGLRRSHQPDKISNGIFSISWGAVAGLPTEPQRARSGDRPERVCPGLLR